MGGRVIAFVFLAVPLLAQDSSDRNTLRTQALTKLEELKSTLPEKSNLYTRFDETSLALRAVMGFKSQAQPQRDHRDVALDFLNQNKTLFQISPGAQFLLDREHVSASEKNMLFKIKQNGLPVEWSKVSVHVTGQNEVFSSFSSWDVKIANIDPAPTISAFEAKAIVESQFAHTTLDAAGELVYLPDTYDGQAHLACKFKFRLNQPLGLWSAYVDAHSGDFIGAVNELRFVDVTVNTPHYRRDPAQGGWSTGSVRGIYGYSGNGTAISAQLGPSAANGVLQGHASAQGFYTLLRSSYSVVVDDDGVVLSTQIGAGAWTSVVLSSSSASPYPLNTRSSQTFASCGSDAIFSAVRFSFFDVGYLAKTSSQQDDFDYVELLQPGVGGSTGTRLGVYMGDGRSPFTTFPATGPSVGLQLVSNNTNGTGNEGGYQVGSLYCLKQNGATNGPTGDAAVTFPASQANEVVATNVFKHLDEIQLQLTRSESGFSGASRWDSLLKGPVIAHVNFSSGAVNAFFDPELNALYFGDGGSSNQNRNLALATDVVLHEYVHWAIDKVYELANFGQSGAISEALADFFALDAFNFNYSDLSKSTFGEWAFPPSGNNPNNCGSATESCRQLNQATKKKYPDSWVGEIHDDSMILSGALWDLSGASGINNSTTTRGLLKQTLFYFPDSFQSFYEALLSTAGVYATQVISAFNAHGIGSWNIAESDSWESNDAFQTAKAVSSGEKITATIYPSGDVDMYRFVAGAGPVSISLTRPFDSTTLMCLAYGFQVFDISRKVLSSALPSGVYSIEIQPGIRNSYVDASQRVASASLSLAEPKILYLAVSAPLSEYDPANNDPTRSSTLSYELTGSFNSPTGAFSATQVSAQMTDQRKIKLVATSLTGFDVDQSTEAYIDHVDVRDHGLTKLDNVSVSVTATYQGPGRLEASIELPTDFFDKHPSLGSLYLELYVRNPLGKIYSVGLSNEIKIFSDQASLVAYNNVFNPAKNQKATFKYQAASSGRHRVVVYTLAGDIVRTLVDRDEIAGISSVNWDGKNGEGETVASGVYLVYFEGPGVQNTKKVVVVK